MDLIAASTDPLALDIIGGLIIGYRPEEYRLPEVRLD